MSPDQINETADNFKAVASDLVKHAVEAGEQALIGFAITHINSAIEALRGHAVAITPAPEAKPTETQAPPA